MFGYLQSFWTTLTCFADRVSQTVLGWFSKYRRSAKITAERQIVAQAHRELAHIRTTDYATNTQAEIALQGYRALYQQITLPEVRRELLPPTGLTVARVGGTWRIVDQATARTVRTDYGSRKAGRRQQRRAVLLTSATR